MRRSVSFLSTFAFLIIGIANVPLGIAQNASPAGPSPCVIDVPGRPTLKRRQPRPDDPTTDAGNDERATADVEKCQQPSTSNETAGPALVKVAFSGLTAFEEADVLKAFREQQADFPRNRMPETAVVNKSGAVLKDLLQAHGYFHATVTVVPDHASQTLTFVVAEGARLPITEIRFAGNKVFTEATLNATMSDCLSRYTENKPGYDREILELCRYRLAGYIRSRGYLQASLGESKNQITGDGLVITIPVTESVLYRIGEVKIEGAEVASAEQLRSALTLTKGDVADGERLGQWAYQDLKKFYGSLGYIEYTAEIDPHFKTAKDVSNEGVVDLNIIIDEGKRFRLGSIKFAGSNLPESEIRQLFQMNDGDVYSQERFEEGIKKLNDTGLFELIDGDKDSDFKTDEEQALISIVIKVQNNARQH